LVRQANPSAPHAIHRLRVRSNGHTPIRIGKSGEAFGDIRAPHNAAAPSSTGPRGTLPKGRKSARKQLLRTPDRQNQARIGINSTRKREPSIAAQPREHPLKKRPASRHHRSSAAARFISWNSFLKNQIFLRDGWGATFFWLLRVIIGVASALDGMSGYPCKIAFGSIRG